jgi:predicted RNA binding protein YcfA (HicA-like mRNA interferase family)
MPRKVRELVSDLLQAGFAVRSGKGSHRNFVHQLSSKIVTISGNDGDDAKHYQEKAVKLALAEIKK